MKKKKLIKSIYTFIFFNINQMKKKKEKLYL